MKLLVDELMDKKEITNVEVYSLDRGYPSQVDGVTVNRFYSPTKIMEISNVIAGHHFSSELDKIDLLHAYNMELHPIVGYLSARTDTPSVATLNSYTFLPSSTTQVVPDSKLKHLYKEYWLPTIGRALTKQLEKIDRFFALSDPVKESYSSDLLSAKKISVVPNMADPNFEESLTPNIKNSDIGTVKLLYVGSLIKSKGVEYLIKSLEKLPDSFVLSVVGTGPRKEHLQKLSASLKVEQQVRFHGYVEHGQLGQLYSKSDIFVHPGIWREPFGRTILEAMQAKLPVVCTNIGAPPRIISGKKNICDVADPVDLAKAIRYTSENRDRLGEANYEIIKTEYQPKQVVSDVVDQYAQVISNHQGK